VDKAELSIHAKLLADVIVIDRLRDAVSDPSG
jgi:hypothetical protein